MGGWGALVHMGAWLTGGWAGSKTESVQCTEIKIHKSYGSFRVKK